MASGADGDRTAPREDRATFALDRFAWAAPDRLEVAGTFAGLPDAVADAPLLVVRSADGTHRLPVVSDSVSGPPSDGQPWSAAFAWLDAPAAFEAADLELGDGLVVRLPAPGATPEAAEARAVEVSRPDPQPADEAAGALRLQADLVAAHEEAGRARAELERVREELARARQDLEAERRGRAEDAERFRDGLDRVREAGEQALRDVQQALDARDTALEAHRAEVAELRDRLAELEREADERARRAAEESQDEIARLRNRLDAIRDAMGEG